MRAEKRNKAARLECGGVEIIVAALDELEILIFDAADRDDHSAAFGKLGEKRRGDRRRSGSHENGVVWGEFW